MSNPMTNLFGLGQRRAGLRIMGHDVPGVRLTAAGALWLLVYLGLPVLVLGNLLDALTQLTLGWCVGLWCIVS